MSFEESFLYPLGLLAIGSLISMFLVPRFSDRYSKKRHQLEIKKDLIVKITELDAEWHIVLDDMAYPLEDETENAKIITKLTGELEKKESVITSLMNLYFDNDVLHSKWGVYSESHPKYFEYLSDRKEIVLIQLSDLLESNKIKSLTGERLSESIEARIGIILKELLELVENTEIRKLKS